MDTVKNGVSYRIANETNTEKVVKFILEHFLTGEIIVLC